MNSIYLAFFTGLISGGISCLAVQGGLLTSSITQQSETKESKRGKIQSILMFLLAKLTAYTLLGLLLGIVGSFLILSLKVQAFLQIAIAFFLFGTAGKLFNLHPIFRYFSITPPKFVYQIIKKESRHAHLLTPLFLGALTVLIPCGVTQAMMALALGTGNPLNAAAIMFSFVLGTSPVFFLLGATLLEMLKKKALTYIAAGLMAIMGIISLNSASALLGSVHTIQNYWAVLTPGNQDQAQKSATISNKGIQKVTIFVNNGGYTSDVKTLKVGVPVKLKLVTNKTHSCTRAFTIPSLKVAKILPESGVEEIEFTPTKTGKLSYTCSMGMYGGFFEIVE